MNHAEMVKQLCKTGEEILDMMSPADAHNIHMAMGVAGEAGEVSDLVKKSVIYNKVISKEDLVEEMGDLEFYLEGLRQGYGITREEVLEANINKLGKRYKGHAYSDKQAQDRADKQ